MLDNFLEVQILPTSPACIVSDTSFTEIFNPLQHNQTKRLHVRAA
jgi:hypothetical protein